MANNLTSIEDVTLPLLLILSELAEATKEPEAKVIEAIALVTRLLTRRLGQNLSEEMRSRLSTFSLPVLEDLSEALLDFTSLPDLENWLATHEGQ